MPFRYLFGPVTAEFADQHLLEARRAGRCLTFNPLGDTDLTIGFAQSWDAIDSRLPTGWVPDLIVLRLDYATIPEGLWKAPIPLIGLAGDWNLLWHYYRHCLPLCDMVLTDLPGVETLSQAGFTHIQQANLFGLGHPYLHAECLEQSRDIDLLFVGNFNPGVQRERIPWLTRLVRLGKRLRVVLATDVFGAEYRKLLSRSRIVFNRSIRGECNLRILEASAFGCLSLQEQGNREVPLYFEPGREYAPYTNENFEEVVEYFLVNEQDRSRMADAARHRVRDYSFEALLTQALEHLAATTPQLLQPSMCRVAATTEENVIRRSWQSLCASLDHDPSLVEDLVMTANVSTAPSALFNARGMVEVHSLQHRGRFASEILQRISTAIQQAVSREPKNPLFALNLAEVLLGLNEKRRAANEARCALCLLDAEGDPSFATLDALHFPPDFDFFRIEWERAAWSNAGRPDSEAKAKSQLLRWRLHQVLAALTGEISHYHEAVLARPDLPNTRAALGCALGRASQPRLALSHLRIAVDGDPLDLQAARALHQAMVDVGLLDAAARFREERELLAKAAPSVMPWEEWITPKRKPISQDRTSRKSRVSLCMIVRNEEANLPNCLASVASLFDEIIVVDTGSTDRTNELAVAAGARVFDFPWIDHFAAARNESLRHATGDWIFWLDADDRLDESNRTKLKALLSSLKDDQAAYTLKCRCLPDASGSTTTVDHVRLFRNRPDVRWEFRVHEQILLAVRQSGAELRWADVIIDHAGYVDPALRHRKLERDLRLLQLEEAERPGHPFTLFNLGWHRSWAAKPKHSIICNAASSPPIPRTRLSASSTR